MAVFGGTSHVQRTIGINCLTKACLILARRYVYIIRYILSNILISSFNDEILIKQKYMYS